MKFTTYNIQFGRGLDGEYDLDRIARTVRGADVIALQEVERYFPRSGNIDQVEELAERLPEYYWVYGAGVDIHANVDCSNSALKNKRQQFGNMLLSKTPILTSRNHLLPKYASTGPLSIQRSALEGVIQCETRLVRVYSIHLTHISATTRIEQLERILEIHQNSVMEGGPVSGDPADTIFADQIAMISLPREAVLLGDFNFTPDSLEYELITGPVSDYGGRIVNPEGFVDAWVVSGHDEQEGVTAERLGEPVRMDYCFVNYSLSHLIRSVAILSEADGSDHKPVAMEIEL